MQFLGSWQKLTVYEIDRDFVYFPHPLGLTEEVEKEVKNPKTMEPEIVMEEKPVLIPMAHNQTTKLLKENEEVEVFLYNKKDGLLAATMKEPMVNLNEFAYLKIVGANSIAYFAHMGLDADLFIHKKEDGFQPDIGKKYIVSLRYDELTGKLYGEMDLERLLDRKGFNYKIGEEIKCQIIGKTEGGFKVNAENKYLGYLSESKTTSEMKMGVKFKGYVIQNKPGSLVISMLPSREKSLKEATHKILMLVQEMKYVRLTENSDEEEIKLRLKMTKDLFKEAVNELSAKELIVATKRGLKLKKVTT